MYEPPHRVTQVQLMGIRYVDHVTWTFDLLAVPVLDVYYFVATALTHSLKTFQLFFCCFGGLVFCTFSLFLLLTALHAIDYVTRLLPARNLQESS